MLFRSVLGTVGTVVGQTSDAIAKVTGAAKTEDAVKTDTTKQAASEASTPKTTAAQSPDMSMLLIAAVAVVALIVLAK